jgi:hypothetical protein
MHMSSADGSTVNTSVSSVAKRLPIMPRGSESHIGRVTSLKRSTAVTLPESRSSYAHSVSLSRSTAASHASVLLPSESALASEQEDGKGQEVDTYRARSHAQTRKL